MQACKVLREEGYEIVLVNSNPATIMTDPEFADATYVEPLLPGPVAQVIEKERPDALLPTLGGQTALNLAKALHEDGTLEKYGVELIGANYDAINTAEDRELFQVAMAKAGLAMPANTIVDDPAQVDAALAPVGLPAIIRPAFTLGGRGGGIARTEDEFRTIVTRGLQASPIGQVLVDQSVLGWGEFELEVMRDHNDNVVIVCSIENIDPMGVHTGDSVTVAPQQTLTDRLYNQLRDQAMACIRAVGVETGGSNVQFAVNPETEEILVIEMNPRVSRSSALASKATGFPIAKIAARLAVGYSLEEIPNDITKVTPASFEPTIDYVVVKWPRFAFEKFSGANAELSTHMKSVGEAMAIGRTFGQAFMKAMRSRELDATPEARRARRARELLTMLERPARDRYDVLLEAFRKGATIEDDPRRHLDRPLVPARAAGAGARPRGAVRRRALVQGRRHLRGGVRRRDAVLLLRLGAARPSHEVKRGDNASVVILGAGPEPHRPGHRVRLLLRARGDDRARLRPRRGDGQLQPRDGLHRLRHLRPPVLRAADAGGRARRHRGREARGRHRPVRRPDAAAPRARAAASRRRRSSARASTRSTSPRTAAASATCWSASATRRRRTRRRTRSTARWTPATRSATRCSSARPTCSAAARWRSSTRATGSPTT